MIFSLVEPWVLAGLLAGFLLSGVLRTAILRLFTRGAPSRLGVAGGARRRSRQPFRRSQWLDPYGTAAGLLSGAGWSPRVDPDPRTKGIRGSLTVQLAVGLVSRLGVAAAAYWGVVELYGDRVVLGIPLSATLHGDLNTGAFSAAEQVLLGAGAASLAAGLLSLIPIPPLEAGMLLWSRLPRSDSARRGAYHLIEEDWGIAILLGLLLIPLVAGVPVLIAILNASANAILRAAL